MKIIYDNHQEAYLVKIEEIETITMFNTKDITEVREGLVKCVTTWFNNAVCDQLRRPNDEEVF